MDFLPLPITLVVKAPNQEIADQTVECALDWTIKRLKNHLSDVYPSQPQEHQQRIIYSGKLLQDDLQLKDILRQFEPDQRVHTVHLVCSNPESYTTKHQTKPSTPSDTMATEGVRHRRGHHGNGDAPNQPVFSNMSSQPEQIVPTTASSTGAGLMNHTTMGYPTSMGMIPPQAAMVPGFPYSPEQMMWLQQMYTQQMAQYMQYYQGLPNTNQAQDSLSDQQPANQNAPAAQVPNQQAAPERDQPMVMNAAGDAVMDDEDENGNRDWLDWMYTCSRFVVLLSIVYFYSTFSRFMLVVGSFMLLYLYQQGWFQLQREGRNRRPEARRNEPEHIQNAENARREEENSETELRSEEEGAESESDESVEAPPSIARTAFSFMTTFFTSLVPQPPPPVNIN